MKIKSTLLSVILLLLVLVPINVSYNLAIGDKIPAQLSVASDNVSVVTAVSDNQTFILRNPTFQELKDFILGDPISRNTFVLNQYECRHFATDVVNDAVANGLMCGFVLICYNQGQHAVVAFNTIDRGLIYIEPQTDAAIEPKVGGTYQGQEIKEILIAW